MPGIRDLGPGRKRDGKEFLREAQLPSRRERKDIQAVEQAGDPVCKELTAAGNRAAGGSVL